MLSNWWNWWRCSIICSLLTFCISCYALNCGRQSGSAQFRLTRNSRWCHCCLFLSFLMSSALRPLLFIWTLHKSHYCLANCDSLLKTSRTPSQNHIPAPHNSPSPSFFPRRILLSNEHQKMTVKNLKHWKIFRTGRLQGEEEPAHICRVTQQEGKLCRPPNVTQLRIRSALWKSRDEQEQKHEAAALFHL